jgi:hypothetical protein
VLLELDYFGIAIPRPRFCDNFIEENKEEIEKLSPQYGEEIMEMFKDITAQISNSRDTRLIVCEAWYPDPLVNIGDYCANFGKYCRGFGQGDEMSYFMLSTIIVSFYSRCIVSTLSYFGWKEEGPYDFGPENIGGFKSGKIFRRE